MTDGNSRLANLPAWVPVLVPVGISVVSLVVSIIGLVISLMLPKADLELPFFVRVQQGEQIFVPNLYVQPSFVSTSSNTRSEVIKDLELVVKSEQGRSVEFVWVDQGEWISPDPTQAQNSKDVFAQYYKITSDPTPLVISPGNAVVPVLHFVAPTGSGFEFKEGSYDLTLTADRALASEPLEDKMTITFTQDQVNFFKDTKGTQWQFFWDAKRQREQRQYSFEKTQP